MATTTAPYYLPIYEAAMKRTLEIYERQKESIMQTFRKERAAASRNYERRAAYRNYHHRFEEAYNEKERNLAELKAYRDCRSPKSSTAP